MKKTYLTKSLFTSFCESPQLARRAAHDKHTYQQILQDKYSGIDGLAASQEFEQTVIDSFGDKDIVHIDKSTLNFRQRHQSYYDQTIAQLHHKPAIIYQAALLHKKLFCICDLLILNEHGTYDIREIKTKSSIRTQKEGHPLRDQLSADISFQHYVAQQTLGELYSGRITLVYLNKHYTKHGDIDYTQLIHYEDVTPDCRTATDTETKILELHTALQYDKQTLDTHYPYSGGDHLAYFGSPAPLGSIRKVPQIRSKLSTLYHQGHRTISDLMTLPPETFYNKNGKQSKTLRYLDLRSQNQDTIINHDAIIQQYSGLEFPLYFYDYETVSSPVPVFDHTRPRQQVVVQYSCHIMQSDGSITHHEAIIQPGATSNETIVHQLIQDLDPQTSGTYIVRYDGFENKRNEEMSTMYPQYHDDLLLINSKTFDLMEVFSTLNYFDRRFQGSSSIKKVLPVLTDISYDDMPVAHGGQATELLKKLINNQLKDIPTTTKHLLEYCALDTWAMVQIYLAVQKHIAS